MIDLEIPGWLCFDDLKILETLANQVPENGRILEIGGLHGRSAYTLASSCKASVEVMVFDLWDSREVSSIIGKEQKKFFAKNDLSFFQKNLADRNIKNVKPIKMASPPDKWDGEGFDLIFIDGDHSYLSVCGDIKFWAQHLKPGGLIFGDDYTEEFPGVLKGAEAAVELGYELKKLGRFWLASKEKNRFFYGDTKFSVGDKRQVQEFFNYLASNNLYRSRFDIFNEFRHFRLKTITHAINNSFLKSEYIELLDVGCGDGEQYLAIKDTVRSHSINYLGIDFSEEMLKLARGHGLTVNYGEMTSLPLKDKVFDVVICLSGSVGFLQEPDERKKSLEEMKRVCKPGGLVIFDVLTWYRDIDYLFSLKNEGAPVGYYHLFAKRMLNAALKDLGFSSVECIDFQSQVYPPIGIGEEISHEIFFAKPSNNL